MLRLINADRFCEYCVDYDICKDEHIDYCFEQDLLAEQPTIEPESLRKKGEWKLNEDGKWACTYCESLAIEHPTDTDWQVITAFCPNCGADMRGEKNV